MKILMVYYENIILIRQIYPKYIRKNFLKFDGA